MNYEIDPSCQLPREFLASLYDACFRGRRDGCYVEVGAYDGVKFGHTSALAALGWRGLCIEPHPDYAARCRRNHEGRNVTVVECAAGAHEGTAMLYVSEDEDGACSSTVLSDASRHHKLDEKRPIEVPMMRLDTVLKIHEIPQGFDVFSLDVEEAELEALTGFDLAYWRPKVAIVETHECDPNPVRNWKATPIGMIFASAGYQKSYADETNTVFVRL